MTASTALMRAAGERDMSKFPLRLEVLDKRRVADDIVGLSLGGKDLPDWTPGAHIELALADGQARAYSLVGGEMGRRYDLAVLREPNSRGGSAFIHDRLGVGDILIASEPTNAFSLSPAPAYAFFAGGIGITPVLPMIDRLNDQGLAWTLHYLGRTRSRLAFLDALAQRAGQEPNRVHLHIAEEGGRANLADIIGRLPDGTAIYACGPNRMMDALADHAAHHPALSLHMERFGRLALSAGTGPEPIVDGDLTAIACDPDGAFEVEFRKTGKSVRVEPGQSILDCARTVRQGLSFSCADGYCGTCETAVIAGVPDHRDTVLTDDERQACRTMMICVGRSRTKKLVIDL